MFKILAVTISLAMLLTACPSGSSGNTDPSNDPPTRDDQFCGSSTKTACASDSECVQAGCSNQMCVATSESDIVTTCQWKECYKSEDFNMNCLCIDNKCQWGEPGAQVFIKNLLQSAM